MMGCIQRRGTRMGVWEVKIGSLGLWAATFCNTPYAATHCDTQEHHCAALHRTATFCNTLQHTAILLMALSQHVEGRLELWRKR